ncbi:hypothetical protein ACMBCM_05755, partial [Spiroplasma sp. K1]
KYSTFCNNFILCYFFLFLHILNCYLSYSELISQLENIYIYIYMYVYIYIYIYMYVCICMGEESFLQEWKKWNKKKVHRL